MCCQVFQQRLVGYGPHCHTALFSTTTPRTSRARCRLVEGGGWRGEGVSEFEAVSVRIWGVMNHMRFGEIVAPNRVCLKLTSVAPLVLAW